MSEWLNRAFSGFDFAILEFGHNLHNQAGGFFDGFMKFVTVFGDGGIILILLSIILMAFKKTRKIGITMFGAIAIGAIITNLTIKPLVARPRPYADESSIFHTWWVAVGSVQESEFSFPSGHSTASMAAMMAFFLAGNKKYSWTGFFAAFLIGFSRIYLCVHYPSDVLFGFIVGIISGSLSYLIVWLVYKYTKGTKFGDILYDKDIITLYNFIKNKYGKNDKTNSDVINEDSCDTKKSDSENINATKNIASDNSLNCDKIDSHANTDLNDDKGNIKAITNIENISDNN